MFDMSFTSLLEKTGKSILSFKRQYDVLGSPEMMFLNFCILPKTIVMNQF